MIERGAGRPASPLRVVAALTAMELRLVSRRGENLFATLVIPAVVLVLFGTVGLLPIPGNRAVDFLLPGSITLGIIATCLVSLGITTAYDRSYGVLKRLGGSPLSRGELIAARVLTVLAVELVQVALLIATAALVLGWTPSSTASLAWLVVAALLGSGAFAGLGLLLAGTLRAETVLALANVLFLAFITLGGVIVPVERLPEPLAALTSILPAAPLSELLRFALGSSGTSDVPVAPLVVLGGWAAATLAATAATFSWD